LFLLFLNEEKSEDVYRKKKMVKVIIFVMKKVAVVLRIHL